MQIVYALLFLILTLFASPMHNSLFCFTLQPTPVVRILKAPGPEMLHQLLVGTITDCPAIDLITLYDVVLR